MRVEPKLYTFAREIFLSSLLHQNIFSGVSVVAQQVTNPTGIHEDVGSIPDLAQWVKDPLLL